MRKLLYTLSLTILCSIVSFAFATPPPALKAPGDPKSGATEVTDSNREEAKRHFERGLELVNAEAWDAALAEFSVSTELNQQARKPKENAARCLFELHRYDEAMDLYESVLHDFKDKLSESELQWILQSLGQLEGLVGTLAIEAPAEAEVSIDSRNRGSTPLAPLRVAAGTHIVRVYKRNFRPFETRVEVPGRGRGSVRATLEQLTQSGTLKVVEQSGAALDVVVDAVKVGTTPWEGQLAVGEHTVLLLGADQMGTQPASAPVRLDEVTTLVLAAEPLTALVRVDPMPGGASVAIDGVLVGHGSWKGQLRAGAHRVEVAAEGFLPFLRDVLAATGTEISVSAELERDPAAPIWRAGERARIFAEASLGATFTPLYGGTANDECLSNCSRSIGFGASVMGRVGYRFAPGFGLSIDFGYLRLRQSLSGRVTSTVHRTGEPGDRGIADDALRVEGLVLGASAAILGKGRFPIHFRLGFGGLLAAVAGDHLTLRSFNVSAPYAVDALLSTHTGYVFVAPDVGVGMRVGDHVQVDVGIAALLAFATSSSDAAKRDQPTVTSSPSPALLQIDTQSLTAGTMMVFIPSLTGRFEF